jgi:DNA-directed RNA polymerase specialized sigma24 family protein
MGIVMDERTAPVALPADDLCRRCREETARYRRGDAHDDRYCFEMIARAIRDRDERCWTEVYALFSEQVLAWCRRAAGDQDDPEELLALTWEKFLRGYTPAKLAAASGVAAALQYLKMCARSVAIDRARARRVEQPLDAAADIAPGSVEQDSAAVEQADLWRLVAGHLHDDRERLVVRLTYVEGLKPAEVQAAAPELFPDVREVYRVTRNILDRLRRSTAMHEWRESDR